MTDFLTPADVLAMHADQIQRYGGHPGIRYAPDPGSRPGWANRRYRW